MPSTPPGSLIAKMLLAGFMSILIAIPALAGGKPKPTDAEELVITDIFVDELSSPAMLMIYGRFFDNGDYLTVSLGSMGELIVLSESHDLLVTELPDDTSDGSYRLAVQTGDSSNQYNEFEVTLGATGPQGPIGPEGPVGATGPEGPAGQSVPTDPDCELEERIYRAVEGFDWDPACPAPSDTDRDGFTIENGDCDDREPEARPDQTSWFTEALDSGSYDWNCDTQEEQRYEFFNFGCSSSHEWETDLTASLQCGETGPTRLCRHDITPYNCQCDIFTGACDTCYTYSWNWAEASSVIQGCR